MNDAFGRGSDFDEDTDEDYVPVKKKGSIFTARKKAKVVPKIPDNYGHVTPAMFGQMQTRGYHCVPVQRGTYEFYDDYSLIPMLYKANIRYPVVFVKQSSPLVWVPLETPEEVTEAFKALCDTNWYGVTGSYTSNRRKLPEMNWADLAPFRQWVSGKVRIHYDAKLKMVILQNSVNFKEVKEAGERYDVFINARKANIPINAWALYLEGLEQNLNGNTEDAFRNVFINNLDKSSISDSMYEAEELTTGATAAVGSYSTFNIFASTGVLKTPNDIYNKIKPYDPDAYLKECVDAMVEGDTRSINSKTTTMRDLHDRAAVLARDISRLRMTSDLIKQNGPAHIRSVIDKMAALPNIEGVEYRKRGIVFTSKEIWTEPDNRYDKHYPAKYVGKYEILVDFTARSVRVRNVAMDARGNVATVASTGTETTCLGTYRSILEEAMAMADYEILLMTLMQFLCDTHLDDSVARSNLSDKFFATRPTKTCSSMWINIVS